MEENLADGITRIMIPRWRRRSLNGKVHTSPRMKLAAIREQARQGRTHISEAIEQVMELTERVVTKPLLPPDLMLVLLVWWRGADGKQKTVVRSGGGQSWTDSSLLEWDPAHFRLFVGNLAGEVTDESLLKAFAKYPSVQKSRVVRDKRTTKSKGFGFVSFSDGDEYFQAAKEMQGKYIGSHPVLLRKSTTEIKPVNPIDKKKKKGGKDGGQHGNNSNTGAGIQKKNRKTKGGLKILG